MNQPFVKGSWKTPSGPVPKIDTYLSSADRWGTIKARWTLGRMNYTVDPGLYALGEPDETSEVLVTANYKMSFDHLRQSLAHRHLWILVLDTNGINVWCAAGKGTFGTQELENRLVTTDLTKIVSHRRLILPQLGAPGVSAHEIKKQTGFKVIYGPIQASDLLAFLDDGLKATSSMRRKAFPIRERIVLIPVELVGAFKWLAGIIFALLIFQGIAGNDGFWTNINGGGLLIVLALLSALMAGAVLTPILLPWLPGRPFSLKGTIAGFFSIVILLLLLKPSLLSWTDRIEVLAWLFMVPAMAAFLAMNFTGASTYTSLSGVKREMKFAVPLEISFGAMGLFLWLGSKWMS